MSAVLLKYNEVAEVVGRELREPRFAGTDDGIGKFAFVVNHLTDAFFDRAFTDHLVDIDSAFLSESPCTVGGLVFDGRVPPAVVMDDL